MLESAPKSGESPSDSFVQPQVSDSEIIGDLLRNMVAQASAQMSRERDTDQTAGAYGIGRYNGVEDTWSSLKNHEVREAPAAAVLLTAHRHLEQLTLTADELRVKNSIDYEWVSQAVRGLWFSDLFQSLTRLIADLSKPVTGDVSVRLAPGGTYVLSVASPYSLGMETPLASVILSRASQTLAVSRLDTLDREVRAMLS